MSATCSGVKSRRGRQVGTFTMELEPLRGSGPRGSNGFLRPRCLVEPHGHQRARRSAQRSPGVVSSAGRIARTACSDATVTSANSFIAPRQTLLRVGQKLHFQLHALPSPASLVGLCSIAHSTGEEMTISSCRPAGARTCGPGGSAMRKIARAWSRRRSTLNLVVQHPVVEVAHPTRSRTRRLARCKTAAKRHAAMPGRRMADNSLLRIFRPSSARSWNAERCASGIGQRSCSPAQPGIPPP